MISYAISHARSFAALNRGTDIVLSTDDQDIKSVAEEFGLTTAYLRPEHLAGDTTGKMEVLNHVLDYQESLHKKTYDLILDLDITSPLRTQEDLKNGLQLLLADEKAYNIFSVSRPHRNPYFNVIELKEDGYCKVVKPSDSLSRQAAPKVYDMNASFYFFRRICFEKGFRSSITERSLFYLMDHVCFDLDEPIDFEMMEFLLSQEKLDFKI